MSAKITTDIPPNTFNISQLSAMMICGKMWSEPHLKRILKSQQVPMKACGRKNSYYYDIEDVTNAVTKYLEVKAETTVGTRTGKYNQLREQKLKKEIDKLNVEIDRAKTFGKISQIEYENLKRTSVPTEEVKDFLLLRYGVENAILRQILLVSAPIDLFACKDDLPKFRERCEKYYNTIQDVMHDTPLLWQQRCLSDSDGKPWPPNIQRVIDELNAKLNNNGKSNEQQSDSSSTISQ